MRTKRQSKSTLEPIHPNAAGIDIGAQTHWVCHDKSVFGRDSNLVAFDHRIFKSLTAVEDTLCLALNQLSVQLKCLHSMTFFPHLRITV